jgi:hypothetical protein
MIYSEKSNVFLNRNIDINRGLLICLLVKTCTGESRYTRFCYPSFRISAVSFQYHEEHQYLIHGHVRSCRTGIKYEA